MSEAETISGSSHGSEQHRQFTTQVTPNHLSTEEVDDDNNKLNENSKTSNDYMTSDLKRKQGNSVASEPKRKSLDLLLENTDNSIETSDPISSLEEITKSPLRKRRIGSSLLSSLNRKRRAAEIEQDSDEEELLDIQAIEEDVNRSHTIAPSNEIHLIKGASCNNNDQVKAAVKSDQNHSNSKLKSPTNTKVPGRNRKVSSIPVGIAVAWQRNSSNNITTTPATTTSSSNSSLTSIMSSTAKPKKAVKSPISPFLPNSVTPPEELSSPKEVKKKVKPAKPVAVDKLKKMCEAKGGRTMKTNDSSSCNDNTNELALNLKSNVSCESRTSVGDDKYKKKAGHENVKSISSAGSFTTSSSFSPIPSNNASLGSNNNNSNSLVSERYINSNGDGLKSLNNNTISPLFRDSWPSSQLVPQGYAAAAAFLQHQQQLSMHQTMQLQLSHSYGYNISSCIYSGYSPEALLQYEQFLRQQQHQLFERQQQQPQNPHHSLSHRERYELAAQSQFSNSMKTLVSPSNTIASPRINIPATPSPAHASSTIQPQSLYSHNSSWPTTTDFYQQYQQLISTPPAHQGYHPYPGGLHHQQLMQTSVASLSSSTATLSPRSCLSSATPSPITIHDSGFQSLLNRKCITPNPMSKNFPAFSSPFSPSILPPKDIWKDNNESGGDGKITPIPLVKGQHQHYRKKSSTISSLSTDDVEERKEQEPDDFDHCDLDERRLANSMSRCDSRQLSSPSYKHDFRRMESLIEKRAEGSLPLLSSSSSIISANESRDLEEVEDNEVLDLKVVKKSTSSENFVVNKYESEDDRKEESANCDGMETTVPDSKYSCDTVVNLNTVKKKTRRNAGNDRKEKAVKVKPKSKKLVDQLKETKQVKKSRKPNPKQIIETETANDLDRAVTKPKKKSSGKDQKDKSCKKDTQKKESKKKSEKATRNMTTITKKSGKKSNAKVDTSSSNHNNISDSNSSRLNLSKEGIIIYERDSSDQQQHDSRRTITGTVVRERNEGGGRPCTALSFGPEAAAVYKYESRTPSTGLTSSQVHNSTLYCDNDIKKPSNNSFHLDSSSSSSLVGGSAPATPSIIQYPHNQVFTSPQAFERRISSHSSSHSHEGSIDSSSTIVFHSLPSITISPDENHLNLLATVAEEVGPYISSRNVSPVRYDLMATCNNNKSYQEEQQDDCCLRRHSTESLYAAVAVAAAAAEEEESNSNRHQERSKSLDLSEPISKPNNHNETTMKTMNTINSSQLQLKIPQLLVTSQTQDANHQKKMKMKQPKMGKQVVTKPKKKPDSNGKPKSKKVLDINNTQKQVKKDSKQPNNLMKNFKKTFSSSQQQKDTTQKKMKKKYIISRKGNSNSSTKASNNNNKKRYSIIPKVEFTAEISEPVSNSTELSSCIYDFDDTKPIQVEPLFNRAEKSLNNNAKFKKNLGESNGKLNSSGNSKKTTTTSNSSKKSSYDLKNLKLGKRNATVAPKQQRTKKIEKPSFRKNRSIDLEQTKKMKKRRLSLSLKDGMGKRKELKKLGPEDQMMTKSTKKSPIPNARKTTILSTASPEIEISPAVANNKHLHIKTEAHSSPLSTAPSLPLHLLTSSPSPPHIPIPTTKSTASINNPPSSNTIETCSTVSSCSYSSESWMTITNPAHVVSAVATIKMEQQERYKGIEDDDNENEDEDEIVKSIAMRKRKMQLKPSFSICSSRKDETTSEVSKKMKLSPPDKKSQRFSPKRKTSKDSSASEHYIKPCLKVEPIIRSVTEEAGHDDEKKRMKVIETKSGEKIKIRKTSIDMNIFSRKVKNEPESTTAEGEEEIWDDNVVINGVEEMIDEMRVLTEIEGLFYTGKLNALQPPDVYGVTLDNERGAPPHIIFSAEEVLEKCIREAKPWKASQLPHGLRICAYWSPMYTGLYPGKVSTDYDQAGDLVPVEFDDGDTGVIKICEIRLLAPDHPVAEYDPNPLLTLEKKHRKRRSSSANGSQGGCTGDHEERDCGEPYCAKVAKLDEEEAEEEEAASSSIDEDDKDFNNTYRTKMQYWTWSGLGYKRPKTKKNRHKEFFHGIQRGDEIINVGDSALFISNGNDRPFIGRIERFWEKKGQKIVNVRWFYHPEEVKAKKRFVIKYPGALFESPHIDENDVQTIAKKCEVIPFQEYKQKYGTRVKLLNWKTGGKSGGGSGGNGNKRAAAAPKHTYYVAGFYDPYTYNLQMKDLK